MTRSLLLPAALTAALVLGPMAAVQAADLAPPANSANSANRDAPNQRPDEVAETTILNGLIAHGYAAIGPLRRDGDLYYVDVLTTTHEPQTLRIDPRTHEVTPIP